MLSPSRQFRRCAVRELEKLLEQRDRTTIGYRDVSLCDGEEASLYMVGYTPTLCSCACCATVV